MTKIIEPVPGVRGTLSNPGPSSIPGSKDLLTTSVEAVVDATPQKLDKTLKSFASACLALSSLPVSGEAQITLQALMSCFERQGCVREGVVKDLVWGFTQVGIPRECTLKGLKDLAASGVLKFQRVDGTPASVIDDQFYEAWIRYTPKLLDLVYEDESSAP